MNEVDLGELRRIVAAVARLRGELVREVTVRSDVRQIKVELESGLILVVSAERDEQVPTPLGGGRGGGPRWCRDARAN